MALLPIVDADTGHSIAHHLGRSDAKSDGEVIKDELAFITKENPVIAEFIERWSASRSCRRIDSALCGILVYQLLRSQAEADEMANYKLI